MRTKSLKRKMSNILLLGILIAIVMGIYYNIYNSRAEKVLEIETIALDNYGKIDDQELTLEATHIGNNVYEIELPKVINGQNVLKVTKATLEDIEDTETQSAGQNTERVAAEIETANAEQTVGENETSNTEQSADTEQSTGETETPNTEQPAGETETSNTEQQTDTEQPTENTETPTENQPTDGTSTDTEQDVENPTENTELEIKDNKITLKKAEMLDKRLKLEVTYDVAILEKSEGGTYHKTLLSEKTEEERKELEEKDNTEIIYQKTLKYEDTATDTETGTETNTKSVELTGYLPQSAKLKVEEVSKERLTEIFGDGQIDAAYDIKIVLETRKQVPVDESNPDGEMKEIIETTEINPEDFGETCEVTINDANILTGSQVYHVKENNIYEAADLQKNEKGNVTFLAQSFSTYAVSADPNVAAYAVSTTGLIRNYDATNRSGSSSTTWKDLSGTQNATITGATWRTDSLYFDGVNDYALSGRLPSNMGAFTFSATVKFVSYRSSGMTHIFDYYDGYGCGLYLYNGRPSVQATFGGSSYESYKNINASSTISTGKYYNIAATYDGSTLKLYLDGTLIGSTAASQYLWHPYADARVTIGAGVENSAIREYSNMYLKSLKIYTRALSQTEIKSDLDTTPPTIGSITASKSATNQSTVTIYVNNVADTGSGIDHVDINGWYGGSWVSTHTSTTGTYDSANNRYYSTFTFSNIKNTSTGATGNGQGTYTFNAWAYDKSGNATVSSTVSVIYDTTAPAATTVTASKTSTNQSTVTIYVSGVSDTGGSGVDYVNINGYFGSTWVSTHSTIKGTYDSTNKRYYATYTFANIKNTSTGATNNGQGIYTFDAWVYDKAGNSRSSSSSVQVTYDTTQPTCVITADKPSLTNASSITYTFTFTENVTGLTANGITVTNGTKGAFSGSGKVYRLVVTNTQTAIQTVTLTKGACKDAAGNTNTEAGIRIRIDRTAPTITANPAQTTNADANNYVKSQSVTITLADSGGAGMSTTTGKYYLSTSNTALSGGSWTSYTSGTAFTIGTGKTGTYYLFTERATDKLGNTSTANGTLTTISGTSYHRFGPYKFDNTVPTVGKITASATLTNQPTVTIYLDSVSDNNSGMSHVDMCGWYGTTYNSTHTTTRATYDSTNNRYYVTFTFADLPDTSTGTKNNGDGTYTFNSWEYDKVGNAVYSSTVSVVYDSKAPYIEILGETPLVTDGLIRNYEANNNTGNGHSNTTNTWKDLSGNYDGIINGATVNSEYTSFDGTDDWVNIGTINDKSAITLEAKIKLNSVQSQGATIIANYEIGGMGLTLWNGVPFFQVYVNGAYQQASAGQTLDTSSIYNITGTYDGSVAKIYINGELKGSKSVSGTIGNPTDNTVMAIGANPYGTTATYELANIDVYSARVYEKALTQAQVQQNIKATTKEDELTKTKNVEVRITDGTSGLAAGATVQYGWSTSNTTEPTTWTNANITSYNSGALSTTFTAVGSGLTGKYYLWVKPTTLKDVAGNQTTASTISASTYWFDNDGPIITVNPEKTTNSNANDYVKEQSIDITVKDVGEAGIVSGTAIIAGVSKSDTDVQGVSWKSWKIGNKVPKIMEEGQTGTYYLFIEAVSDKLGNTSKANGTLVEIGGTSYHRFGPYKFDNTAPTVGKITASATITNQSEVTIYLDGVSDTGGAGMSHVNVVGWYGTTRVTNDTIVKASYDSTNNRYYATLKFADIKDTTTGNTNNGEGTYTFKAYAYDNLENSTETSSTVSVVYDITAPTCVITADKPALTNASSITYTFTFSENVNGFTASDITVTNGTKGTFSGSGKVYTLVVTNSGSCVQTVSIAANVCTDAAGNGNTAVSKSITIDRTAPTITTNPIKTTNSGANDYVKSQSTTITVADTGGAGISTDTTKYPRQYYLSTSSTALSGGSWTNYTSGTAFTIGAGKTGTYYLFVKRVGDNLDNISTANGTLTTISGTSYHRFGPYKFDNTVPTAGTMTMKLDTSSGAAYTNDTWTNHNVYIEKVNGSDAHSGHKATTYTVTKNGTVVYNNITEAVTLNPGDGASAIYVITLTTEDNVGNKATRSYTVKIDKKAPTAATMTMKLDSSSGTAYTNDTWVNRSVYIALNNDAKDEDSGVKQTTYTVNGVTATSNTQTLTETETYTIVVTTEDNVGNKATRTYTVKIDKVNPTAATMAMKLDSSSGTEYKNDTWTNHDVYIALNNDAKDEHSGVKQTTYTVNGGAATSASQILKETGTYTIVITTEDNVGNKATRTYTIKIDKVNPTAATLTMKLDNGSGTDYKNDTWTNHDVYIALNNDAQDTHSGVKQTTYTVNGVTATSNTQTLKETGTYTIVITTEDNVGNKATRTYTVKIDKVNPTAATLTMKLDSSSGTAYTNNTWTNHDVYIALNNDAKDEHSGVKQTTYTVNGGAATSASQTLKETGTYTIVITTEDNVGNKATRTYTIKIDKVNPTAATLTMKLDSSSGTAYTNDTWVNHSVYIALNNDAKDEDSGVKQTTYTVNGGTATSNPQTLTETGTYQIVVTTEDNAGNKSTRNYTVKIDKKVPTVATLTMKLDNSSGTDYKNDTWTKHSVYIALNNDAQDGNSGVKGTTYTVNGGAASSNPTTLTETGTYTIVVTTTDNVGLTTSSTYTIKIDKVNPIAATLTMKLDSSSGTTAYINNTWTKHSVYIALNNDAHDADSGIKGTTYTVNGGAATSNPTTLTETGTYTIVVTTEDNAGTSYNEAGNKATRTYTVKIDKEKPSPATLTMKLDSSSGTTAYINNTWTKHSVYIALNNDSYDAHSGIKGTTYTVNGGAATSNPTTLTETGTYTIVITAEDNAGTSYNETGNEATRTYTIKIDKTNPVAGTMTMKLDSSSGTTAYTNNTWTKHSVYINKVDGSDAHSGHKVTTYAVTKDGAAYLSNQTGAVTLDPGDGKSATYVITVTTEDSAGASYNEAGNKSTRSYTVKIDKKAPTAGTMTMKLNNSSGAAYTSGNITNNSVYIALNNGSDGESGHKTTIYNVYFMGANNSTETDTSKGTLLHSNQTAPKTLEGTGKYIIVVTTEDNAGTSYNEAGNKSTNTYTVVIDKDLPTITANPTKTTNASANDYVRTQSVTLTVAETGVGLNTSNEYQYCLVLDKDLDATFTATDINDAQSSDNTKWKTYTSGTAFTIGENKLTGIYYLMVKSVKDGINNESNQYGTIVTIGGQRYHQFGPYKFDNISPSVEFNPNGNPTWSKSHTTTVTIRDNTDEPSRGEAGVDTTTLRYQWNQSSTVPTESSFDTATYRGTFTTTTKDITSPAGVTGNNWYLWILAKDKLGNTSIVTTEGTKAFYLDNTNPTISISTVYPTNQNIDVSGTTVSRYADITLTTVEEHAKLADSANSYQYYVSTSNTGLTGGEWIDYTLTADNTLNTRTATFRIGEGVTGTRYLFVKRIKDNAGNISTQDGALIPTSNPQYHLIGTYVFDNTAPDVTIPYNQAVHGVYAQSQSITVTVKDNEAELPNAGINFANSLVRYRWTNDANVLTQKSDFSDSMTASTQSLITAGYTGYKYLWIYAEDNIGNSCIVYPKDADGNPRAFYLDNTKPVMNKTITPTKTTEGNVWTTAKVTITFKEEHAGMVTGANNYQYYLSTSSTALTGGTLTNYTAGTEFEIGNTGVGTRYLFVKAVKDKANNESNQTTDLPIVKIDGQNYHVYGPYEFDNAGPKITISPETSTNANAADGKAVQKQKIDIKVEEVGKAGLMDETNPATIYQYYLSTSNTSLAGGTWKNYSLTKDTSATIETRNGSFTIGENLTGTYYLFIKSVKDTLGNESRTTGTLKDVADGGNTIKCHMFGEYVFDNTSPTVTATPNKTTNATAEDGKAVLSQSVTITLQDIGTAGLTSTKGQYYLSSSETELTDKGTAVVAQNYTSGTAFTIGTGKTGTYYLFVKTVTDNAGNISNKEGTMTTISGGTYHKFGPYVFDNSKPTITFNPKENTTWKQKHTTVITVVDVGTSGVQASTLKYLWVKGTASITSEATFNTAYNSATGDYRGTFSSGGTISSPAGVTGNDWNIYVLAKDRLGNTSVVNSGKFYLDNIKPTISTTTQYSPDAGKVTVNGQEIMVCEYADVTLTTFDEDSKLDDTNNSYQYYLSTSNTALENGKWFDYTLTTDATLSTRTATVRIGLDDGNGKPITDEIGGGRYLFVKTIKDKAQNETSEQGQIVTIDGKQYHLFGRYVFDNSKTTITMVPTENTTWQQQHQVTVTITDEGNAGVDPSMLKYLWTQIDTELTTESKFLEAYNAAPDNTKGIFTMQPLAQTLTEVVSSPTGEEINGNNWKLWILAKDILQHVTTGVAKNFYLDNTKPTISISTAYPTGKYTTLTTDRDGETAGTIVTQYADITLTTFEEYSKLDDTKNSYQYYLSTSSTSITGGKWFNYNLTADNSLNTRKATFTIGLDDGNGNLITGVRYLFVKRIADKTATVGNISKPNVSTEEGTLVPTENPQYQLLGKYVFDNTKPNVIFNPEGGEYWAKSHSTVVTVKDDSQANPTTGIAGVNTSSLKYQWVKGNTVPTEASFKSSFTNSQTLSRALGTGNDWYLWILAKDNVGNTTITTTNAFWLDNTKPVIGSMTKKPSSTTTYTLTISGIADTKDVEVQSGVKGYYISTSSTAPTESSTWVPISSNTVKYNSETKTYTVTYEGALESRTYYFWVIDNVGNISQVSSVQTKQIFYSVNDTEWYETFAEAVSAEETKAGDTIKVLKDVNDSSDGTVNKNLKLDTNGKTLTRTTAIDVVSGSSLEVTGTGTITSKSTTDATIKSEGTLKLTSGTITSTSHTPLISSGSGNIEIAGGTVKTTLANSKATITGEGNGTIRVSGGTVEGNIYAGEGTARLTSGTVNGNVHGGKLQGTSLTSNIILEGATITGDIYGGGDATGKVNEVNITLISGTVRGVYGGGINNSAVGTANVVLNGEVDIGTGNIYGGSNTTGTVDNANVYIKSGTINNVYGGGTQGGTTLNTVVTIEKEATILENVYGGAHKATVGNTTNNQGSATVNIVGGTIKGNVYGGSDTEPIYGAANINVGTKAVGNNTLTAGEITIEGNIFGGGHADKTEEDNTDDDTEEIPDFTIVSVKNGTHINIDGNSASINIQGDIFGTGEKTIYEGSSTITIKNLGTTENPNLINSIQRTETLTIDNSHLEIAGKSDSNNLNTEASYALNRISNLKIKNGTYLYLRRGFNLVEELNSLVDASGNEAKATVTIKDGSVTSKNVDNRIYVYEGVNLFIAKEEYSKDIPISEYGKVNGMTFFGMYTHDRSTSKIKYDIYSPTNPVSANTFVLSSYVEGKYDSTHAITVDGFYTNALESSNVITRYIDVIPEEPIYQDWVLDEKIYTQEVTMVAQRNVERVYESVPLDYLNQPGAKYEVKLFSVNSFEPGIELVNRSSIPRVAATSEIANTTFALTMRNGSGWQNEGETTFYTSGTPIRGTTTYLSDYSGTAPYIDFYLYNSINITETKDCGFANLVFVVTKTTDGDASEGTKFKIAVSINIQTVNEIIKSGFQTDARITAGKNFGLFTEKETYITDRSSMTTYFNMYPLGEYTSTDYRVISSTCELPLGTQITMVDYAKDINNPAVYYYEVKSGDSKYEASSGRYIYRLSNFTLMSSLNGTGYFVNDNEAYSISGFEEYRFVFDFKNTTIPENLLKQSIRFELRDGTTNDMKNYEILPTQFNIYSDKRSELTLDVTKAATNVYDMVDKGQLTFTVKSIMTKQEIPVKTTVVGEDGTTEEKTILYPINDTYYDEKKLGMAISIYDSDGNKVPYSKVRGTYYIIDGQEYYPDKTGTARVYLADNVVTVERNVKIYIEGHLLESGKYKVRIENFASDNGTFFGVSGDNQDDTEFNMIDLEHGLKVDITDKDKLVDTQTGKTYEGTSEMNIGITASDIVANTNIRVSLYKRDSTYNEDLTYSGVSYTLVDLANYVSNTLQKPESKSLTSSNSYQYLITNSVKEQTLIDLILNMKENLPTGGYKLEFSIYSGNTCIGTVNRHFVVTDLVTVEQN